MAVDGYAGAGRLVRQVLPGEEPIEQVLDGVFTAGPVAYAHLRNGEAGCFIARVERALD